MAAQLNSRSILADWKWQMSDRPGHTCENPSNEVGRIQSRNQLQKTWKNNVGWSTLSECPLLRTEWKEDGGASLWGDNRPVPPVGGGEVTGPVVWGCCLLQWDWSYQASWLPVSQLMLFQTGGTVLSIMEMLENTETVESIYMCLNQSQAIASFLTCLWSKDCLHVPQIFTYSAFLKLTHFSTKAHATFMNGKLGLLVVNIWWLYLKSTAAFLAVQQFGLQAPTPWGPGLSLGWRPRSHVPQLGPGAAK